MKAVILLAGLLCAGAGIADERGVFLEDADGARTRISTLDMAGDGTYSVAMNNAAFIDHFLSLRPFKCLEGPAKNWCHVPYPYAIARDISGDLTDLEYDFLFLWKGSAEYGINMWNGIYYRIVDDGGALTGTLHEMDMNLLAAPPDAGVMRPLRAQDIYESDPESHWLPKLVIK